MRRRGGLLHVNLNVTSLEKSVRFYCGALGFVEVDSTRDEADLGSGPEPIRQTILTVPSTETILALTQASSLVVASGGLNHLGLILESDSECGAMLERVEELGGSVGKSGTRDGGGVSEAFAYIKDPDGYTVELSTQAILYALFP